MNAECHQRLGKKLPPFLLMLNGRHAALELHISAEEKLITEQFQLVSFVY